MNHSTMADKTTRPSGSSTSIATGASTRPRFDNSAVHFATSSVETVQRADTRPRAGLRNFASSRRTTGMSPEPAPSCSTRNAPDPASATARRALACTVPRWFVYCRPSGRATKNPLFGEQLSRPTWRLNGNWVTSIRSSRDYTKNPPEVAFHMAESPGARAAALRAAMPRHWSWFVLGGRSYITRTAAFSTLGLDGLRQSQVSALLSRDATAPAHPGGGMKIAHKASLSMSEPTLSLGVRSSASSSIWLASGFERHGLASKRGGELLTETS